MSKKQMGFTLIEIVMVLVLLGILAAVAVPKYFDLRAQAEQKTAMAMASEYQARLNAAFAQQLLDGKTCAAARTAAFDEANKMNTETLEGFTVGTIVNTTKTSPAKLEITSKNDTSKKYSSDGLDTLKIQSIVVPQCSGD